MLKQSPIIPVVPVGDLERARAFYEETLGLHPASMRPEPGSLVLEAGGGSKILLDARDPQQVQRINETEHTLIAFEVEDVETEVDDLEKKGVKFEDYDLPNLKTGEHHVATVDGSKAAWLKDPDGNVICIHQPSSATYR